MSKLMKVIGFLQYGLGIYTSWQGNYSQAAFYVAFSVMVWIWATEK